MKILVTGVGGQLGYDICRVLYARNLEYCGVDIEDFDITDPLATSKFITQYTPDAIIHCSCYTAVDRAEEEQELCNRVNVTGTENIARAALSVGAKMMYISTDYVFAGEGENFHRPEDPVSPLSVYGMSKWQGEERVRNTLSEHFIVRMNGII